MSSFSPKTGWILIAAVTLGMLIFQLVQHNWLLSDSEEYLLASENLYQHGTLYCGELDAPFRTDYLSKRPPLYPSLLGILSPIPFLLIVQNILLIFNLWLAWKIYRKLTPAGTGLIFFVLILLSFSLFIYPNLVMTEVWLQSILLGAAWLLLHFWQQGKNKHLVLFALLIGISVWLKPVTWPLAAVLLLALPTLSYARLRRVSVKPWLAGLIAPLFVLVLGGINYQRSGSLHISSITSINLLQYNAYYTSLRAEGPEVAEAWVDEVVEKAKTREHYADRQAFIRSEALRKMGQYPGTYASLHLKGIGHFFLDPGRFDLYHFFGWKSGEGKNTGLLARFSSEGYSGIWAYLRGQGFFPLFLLGLSFLGKIAMLVGIFLACRKHRHNWMILLLLLALPLYLALATGPLGASRFAVPVVPLLVVIAAMGFDKKR